MANQPTRNGAELENWLAAEKELAERNLQSESKPSAPLSKKASAAASGQPRTSISRREQN
jgi:hypothetical protein